MRSAGAAISIVSVAWSAIGAFWPNPAMASHTGRGGQPREAGEFRRTTA